MAAPLSSAAYTSQGPIIQPSDVGHATTSPRLTSICAQASVPALSGVTCVQGMALGSPACRRGVEMGSFTGVFVRLVHLNNVCEILCTRAAQGQS